MSLAPLHCSPIPFDALILTRLTLTTDSKTVRRCGWFAAAPTFSESLAAMNKYVVVSLLSAILGASVATALHQQSLEARLTAQEPGFRRGHSGPALAPAVPQIQQQPTLPLPAPPRSGLTQANPSSNDFAPQDTSDPQFGRSELAMPDDQIDFTPEERTNIAVYEKANRSVVHITTKSARTELLFVEVPTEGAGSGSILDRNGHVLTNYHVVEGAQQIRVTLHDGDEYEATLVGHDAPNDIAVLRISAPSENLIPMQLGDSSRLRVGQLVYAIGNPFGLERTMTTGIISSLNRSLPTKQGRTMKSMIQIDAALNRGNSGGPLLSSRGMLIGMNTAIASSTGENTGVGFSIPIDTIKRVVPQLIQNGRVIRPETGITRVYQSEDGLMIATTAPGGPAERAGLRGFRIVREQKRRGPFVTEERKIDRSQADTIVAVDGQPVKSADEFLALIERHQPGEQAVLGIVREGRTIEVALQLSAGE
jgi:S1-C subfamily serine protease